MKVFLGGTCGKSTWRKELIPWLNMGYFDPVVDDWTTECKIIEDEEKLIYCDVHLYVITSDMIGVYSIAEVIDSIHDRSKFTIFHIMPSGFNESQLKSLNAVADMVTQHNSKVIISDSIKETAVFINNLNEERQWQEYMRK